MPKRVSQRSCTMSGCCAFPQSAFPLPRNASPRRLHLSNSCSSLPQACASPSFPGLGTQSVRTLAGPAGMRAGASLQLQATAQGPCLLPKVFFSFQEPHSLPLPLFPPTALPTRSCCHFSLKVWVTWRWDPFVICISRPYHSVWSRTCIQ